MPNVEARQRTWRQSYRWKKDHGARGAFGPALAGQTESLALPIWWHVCFVCDSPLAPFGHGKRYYCREHNPK